MSFVVLIAEYDPDDGADAIMSTRGWIATPDQVDLVVGLFGDPVVEAVNNVADVKRATDPFITFLTGVDTL